MIKCAICGTTENVRKIKHLPYPQGRVGHVTLTNWTDYCTNCMISEGKKFSEMMDKHIASKKEATP